MPSDRVSWDEYFIALAHVISWRSPDRQTKHGAVIVDGSRIIIGTGYNGLVRGLPETEFPLERPGKYPYMIHAEENALLNCKVPPRGQDATIYVTGTPCLGCFQRIIQAGVSRCVMAARRGTALESPETDLAFWKIARLTGFVSRLSVVDFDPAGIIWHLETFRPSEQR